ncbi:GNAT family N-acetyltransferase [Tessaracoccus sp. OH4464_COT-324]|uniref:GNAT family N-acetyltransferase n=1 Tax=Tessaracoccus sp. OH4464_COT-324 TaxID=2491059 RepID=UPI000F62F921|nr:GNAT family N-acetyltransferase [Tessaracoccus sp. OH4464_COT-324]RRD47024.1 N-acetyltransferase [Tessaracoccus sp. OH4464_COT-324]
MPIYRHYLPDDAESWLRCRALSFLHSSYYDYVWTTRPESPQLRWVACEGDQIVGILDVEIAGCLATIDTVATHPDRLGRGIASQLLARAIAELPSEVTTLDAWTRDDERALAWYRARGFAESDHYLHVHKEWDDPADGFSTPEGAWALVNAHFHAPLELESEMRAKFKRVYVARRFAKEL